MGTPEREETRSTKVPILRVKKYGKRRRVKKSSLIRVGGDGLTFEKDRSWSGLEDVENSLDSCPSSREWVIKEWTGICWTRFLSCD